jgi:hypothetical protein
MLNLFNMTKILTLYTIIAFIDLNLKLQKNHASAPKQKEMDYELWENNFLSTHGLCPND